MEFFDDYTVLKDQICAQISFKKTFNCIRWYDMYHVQVQWPAYQDLEY